MKKVMEMMEKLKTKKALICVVIFIFIFLYWTRHQVVEVHSSGSPGFYKINRFTGTITLIAYNQSFKVITESEK